MPVERGRDGGDAVDWSSFRRLVHAGAPCPDALKRRVIDAFPPGSFLALTLAALSCSTPVEGLECERGAELLLYAGRVQVVACQLRGDAQSAKLFVGEDCGLCKDARWSLQRKQFPETP